jgi:hypothetical protein
MINSVSFKLSSNCAFTPFIGGLQFESRHSGGLQFLGGTTTLSSMIPARIYTVVWYNGYIGYRGTRDIQKRCLFT